MRKSNILPILMIILMIPLSHALFLSADNIKIDSAYGFDKAWIITMTGSGIADSIVTKKIDKDTLNAKQDLIISINPQENICSYQFDISKFQYKDVYAMDFVTESFWSWEDEKALNWINSNCDNPLGENKYYTDINDVAYNSHYVHLHGGILSYDVYCAKRSEKIGTVAVLDNEYKKVSTKFIIQAEGKQPQERIVTNSDTGDGSSTRIGNDIIIDWAGNLDSGKDCPETSELIGLHDNERGWIITNYDYYDSYKKELLDFEDILTQWATGTLSREAVESNFNHVAMRLRQENNNVNYKITNANINNGEVDFYIDRTVAIPVFRLIIDTDYLELRITNGDPKIVDVPMVRIDEGMTQAKFKPIIYNAGEDADFWVTVKGCTDGFSSQYHELIPFKSKEQKQLSIDIVGSSTSTDRIVKGSCELEVKDRVTGKTATKRFETELEQITECEPYAIFCSADKSTILKCNSEGTKKIPIEECGIGYECQDAKCVYVGNGTDDSDKKEFKGWLLAITVIVSLIGGFYASNKLSFLSGKTGKIIRIIVLIAVFIALFIFIPKITNAIIDMFTFSMIS